MFLFVRRGLAFLPVAEKLFRKRFPLGKRDVARENKGRILRRVELLVEPDDVLAFDRLDRVQCANRGVSIRARAERKSASDITYNPARLLQRDPYSVKLLIFQAIDLFLFKGGMADHIRQDLQRLLGLV